MENSYIDLVMIFLILISGLVLLLMLIMQIKKDYNDDTNIEWYGPNICLKKKNYPEINDDHREKILEK